MHNRKTPTLLYLFGPRPAESALLQAQGLIDRVEAGGWAVQLAGLSREAAQLLQQRTGRCAHVVRSGPGWLGRRLRPWRRLMHELRPAVIHAWDSAAVEMAAKAREGGAAACLTLHDARQVSLAVDWLRRDVGSAVRAVCHSRAVQQALLAAGVPADRVSRLPIGVDLDVVQEAKARRGSIRSALALHERDWPVVAVPPPVERCFGHFRVIWALLILRRVYAHAKLVVPGRSPEAERMARFAAACREPEAAVVAEDAIRWPDILAAVDIVAIASSQPADLVPVAWAKAFGLPVVAVRTSGVDELLADGDEALVVDDPEPVAVARKLLKASEQEGVHRRFAASAPAETVRYFDASTSAEAYIEFYSSLAAGSGLSAPAATGPPNE